MVPVQPPPAPIQPVPAIVLPGQDAAAHADVLKQKIATSLTDLYGVKIEPVNLTPNQHQPVGEDGLNPLIQKAAHEIDLEDLLAGERGQVRTDPSKNFLSTLLGRIKKQNPNKEVVYGSK